MESPEEVVNNALRASLERTIRDDGISTLFQPIVDIRDGGVYGCEALSRGTFPFDRPSLMFEAADRLNLSWDLDKACRIAALRNIASLPGELREQTNWNVNCLTVRFRRGRVAAPAE
jgi:EAL domain-containing protein (putative c-di-GMP-specific phosphodiesterase class I)